MKINISDFYKTKGFIAGYVVVDKQPRRLVVLKKQDGSTTTISYARYLYTSYYETDIAYGDEIDHINGDRLDDRIENLQIISGRYNKQKDHRRKEMVEVICPVCKKAFLFEKRNLSTHPNPCCSRRCGGIKSHWK